MSYVAASFAILDLYLKFMGADAGKNKALAEADELDLQAYETDLTRKFNWQQRNKVTAQLKTQTLQSGMDSAAMAGVAGHKVVENMKAEVGSSGVALGAGTPVDVQINQHIQNANQQLAIMQSTDQKLDNIHQNAVAVNEMADFKANMRIKQLNRAASATRSGADAGFFAGLLSAFASSSQTYTSANGQWSTEGFRDDPNSGWYDTWNKA